MKRPFEALLEGALDAAIATGDLLLHERPACVLEEPDHPAFGDATCRVAMGLARRLGRPAADVAGVIVRHVADPWGWLDRVEAAGPGFVNLQVSLAFWRAALAGALGPAIEPATTAGRALVLSVVAADEPEAPRAAVVADVLARLLAAAGHGVERAARPIEALASLSGGSELARIVVVHGRRESGAAARAKAAVARAGGHPGRVTAIATAPASLARRGVAVGPAVPPALLRRPAVRFALAGTPADVPALLDVDRLEAERIDQPYFAVRYALARIERSAVDDTAPRAGELDSLGEDERECLRGVGTHADAVALAARRLAPEGVIGHARALAGAFHRYYNRGRLVAGDGKALGARRALARGVARVLQRTLALAEPPAEAS